MKEQLNLNNVDFASSDPKKMQFARALLAEGKPLGENAGDLAGSRAVMAFDDQGHMTFVFVDQYGRHIEDSEGNKLSIQQSNVDDLLVPKNPAIQTGIDLVTDKAKNRATGAKYGEEYDVNRVSSFVETTILDINGFKNASNYRGVNMDSSLADSLHGVSYDANGEPVIAPTLLSSGVFGELNNLPMSLDITKDGKVNELDFKSEENYKELVDYVLSGKDLELSKKVLQTHLTNISSAHHQLGVDAFTAAERAKRNSGRLSKEEKTKTNPYGIPSEGLRLGIPMPNGYRLKVRKDVVEGYINDIKSGTEFEFKNNKYTYIDGQWVENSGGEFRPGEEAPEKIIGDTQTLTDQVFENGGKYFDGLVTEVEIDVRTGKKTNEKKYMSSLFSNVTIDDFIGDDDVLAGNFNDLLPENSPYTIESAYIFDRDHIKIKYNGEEVKRIKINGSEEDRKDYLKDLIDFFKDKSLEGKKKYD